MTRFRYAAAAVGLALLLAHARRLRAAPLSSAGVGEPGILEARPYAGMVHVLAHPRDGADVARLWAHAEHVLVPHDPAPVTHDLVVSAGALARLRAAGVPIEESPIDVATLIAADRPQVLRSEVREAGKLGIFGPWFDQVPDLDALYAYLDQLAELSRGRATVLDIGSTVEGRPIRALRIEGRNGPASGSILVTGTQHAREWASTMVALGIADALVRRADVDVVARLLGHLAVYVVPVVNVDGYVASHNGLRLQRKNMDGSCSVDLNRNFDIAFGQGLQSDGCAAENYPGRGAFSEPETRAVRDLRDRLPNLRLFLDYHAPAEQVMVPFAFTRTRPDGYAESLRWGQTYADAVESLYGTLLPARDAYDLAQGQGGGAIDWLRAAGIESFAVELRNGRELDGFQLPQNQIVPTMEENWIAFLATAGMAVAAVSPDDPAWPDTATLVARMSAAGAADAPGPITGQVGCALGGGASRPGWLMPAVLIAMIAGRRRGRVALRR